MKRKLIVLSVVFSMVLSLIPLNTAVVTFAADREETGEADVNARPGSDIYADIIESIDPQADAFDFRDEASREALLKEAESFPATFDLRDMDGTNYVTPVRSQAPFGTCWGFAAIAAAESSILGAGLKGADGLPAAPETLNLSEKQLALFSATAINDPDNPQNGEGQNIEDYISIASLMDRGGNAAIASSVLAQGVGPQHESADPIFEYHGKNEVIVYDSVDGVIQPYSYSVYDDWSMPEKYRFSKAYTLDESKILPAPAGRDEKGFYVYNEAGTAAIKQELMNKRAVMVAFCADTSLPSQAEGSSTYISPQWAHYTFVPQETNHMVTIVGWDDNYSRDNFLQGTVEMLTEDGETLTFDKTPPADGAWLVKNSWGSGECEFPDKGAANWGIVNDEGVSTGYFWLSYYDQSLLSAGSLVLDEAEPDKEIINQLDYMPMIDAISYSSDEEMKMSNIFVASSNEVLEQVSSLTTAPQTTVTYEIYLLCDTHNNPECGVKVAEQTFTYEYGGFHKEDIKDFDILLDTSGNGLDNKEILIMKDQAYSIIVTQRSPEGKYIVNFQFGFYEEHDGGVSSFKGVINENETFIYKDEWWNDFAYEEDVRREMADAILGNEYYYSFDNVSFDNFPIKGFCRKADMEDLSMEFSGDGLIDLVYKTVKNSGTMRFSLYGKSLPEGGIPEEDITWWLTDEAKEYVELKPGRNAARAELSAISAPDNHMTFYCGVTIRNLGTGIFWLGVGRNVMRNIMLPEDEDSELGFQIKFPYTGEEVTPEISLDVSFQPVYEGTDYELIFENNIDCGFASVAARGLGDMFTTDTELKSGFVIVPTKAEITSVETVDGGLAVTVKDLAEPGVDGYRIWYRAEGEDDDAWKEADIPAGETRTVISGLQAGRRYEVKAAGYVANTVPMEEREYPVFEDFYYGEESDIVLSGESGNDISAADVTFNGLEVTKAGQYWAAYDGAEKKPEVIVTLDGQVLTADDYDVAYADNKKVGTATVTVTGKGNYTGSAVGTFMITFKDVPATHSYQSAVYWAVNEGIAAGYSGTKAGTFGVNDDITRGQVVMFLWRAAGTPEPKNTTTATFKDVPVKHNFFKAIQWAVEEKIAAGYSGAKKGYFGPSDKCTRGQIVTFLWRYADSPKPSGTTQQFTDVPVSHNFYNQIQWAYENGITAGFKDGSFGVTKNCTRGQCVTFLYRLVAKSSSGQ